MSMMPPFKMFKSFLTIPRRGMPSKHRVPIAFTTCGHHVEHCVVSSMLQHLKYTSTRWLPMKTSNRQPISIICSWRTFHPQVLLHWHLHQQPTNSDWIWFQPLPIAFIEKAWIPFALALFSCVAKWWQCKKPHWVHASCSSHSKLSPPSIRHFHPMTLDSTTILNDLIMNMPDPINSRYTSTNILHSDQSYSM
jgi:hypothetical protein